MWTKLAVTSIVSNFGKGLTLTCALRSAGHHGKLSPNSSVATAVITADSKSPPNSSRRLTVANIEADIESTASELPCGSAQETLVRGQATGVKTTVDATVLKREDKSLQTTIMLITVSTSYVLAYLPVLFHFVVTFILLKLDRSFVVGDDRLALIAGNYTKLLYVGGVAVNFFLYTVSGRVFRKQLIQMLSCRRQNYAAVSGVRRHAAPTNL